MADNFISGNTSYVKLGATPYAFNKWRLAIAGGNKKFFAFGSNFQRTLPGTLAGVITLEGFYNRGNMPLTVGALVEVHLGFETGSEAALTARVGDIEFGSELKTGDDPGGTVTVTLDTDGVFPITSI